MNGIVVWGLFILHPSAFIFMSHSLVPTSRIHYNEGRKKDIEMN